MSETTSFNCPVLGAFQSPLEGLANTAERCRSRLLFFRQHHPRQHKTDHDLGLKAKSPSSSSVTSTSLAVVLQLAVVGGIASDSISAQTQYPVDFSRDTSTTFTRIVPPGYAGLTDAEHFAGGVAAADYDGDGDVDFYVVGRTSDPNHLYENLGDGRFREVGATMGLDVTHWGSGPSFGDYDGDGDLDLFVGAVRNNPIYLFENRLNERDGTFVDVTAQSQIRLESKNTVSSLFFDYDQDGHLDLFLTHWGSLPGVDKDTETVWRNNGDGTFSNVSLATGIDEAVFEPPQDWTFTPSLTDIDNDGDPDLLMTGDFETSQVLKNRGDGTFRNVTDRDQITDQFGMGSAVADFDNDGDMDWFVSSVYDPEMATGPSFGNRLYANSGNGVFTDSTRGSGVADAGWAWGSCAGDFDNDGFQDLVVVNGWGEVHGKDYGRQPTRFFRNRYDGSFNFDEIAGKIGLHDFGQGRGLACFDADRDGDLDVIIANNSSDHVVYFRNNTTNDNHYLGLKLRGIDTNRFAIGARITATSRSRTQIRDLGSSNNYASHDPFEVHFGLGSDDVVDLTIRWPDGTVSTKNGVRADQVLTIVAETTTPRLVVFQGTGSGQYGVGESIQISAAEPAEGYFFSHWSSTGGGSFEDSRASTTSFTMPSNTVSIKANYLPGVAPGADVSVARRWIEVLLQAIRNDYARPTVHARNLFHTSAAIYDAWVAYGTDESPWLLGRSQANYACSWTASSSLATNQRELLRDREKAISYASYRMILHRFGSSPGYNQTVRDASALMDFYGYNRNNHSRDWQSGDAAALGNYISDCYVGFGMGDGSNEANDYAIKAYKPVNPALEPHLSGNPKIEDLNRWQPLSLELFIDQSGNESNSEPEFVGPEWGAVWPFALEESDLTIRERDGYNYWIYHDPGPPPKVDDSLSEEYKWGFALVAIWSAHLDAADGIRMDISPAAIGNISSMPRLGAVEELRTFYDLTEGGDFSSGYDHNPITGLAYAPQNVLRGDYARVLAEFWADGPDSETPPGHWFVILNEVNDHPDFERRLQGAGPELSKLEWDVKSYFTLGGAMHDAAITAWGVKGFYDYIRPISALRAMADLGQSSSDEKSSYHIDGIPLHDGYIELVTASDSLSGSADEHVGKIKFRAWKGPDYIEDPTQDIAGVDWILAENWWPYQRPSFVTPPFAGYISGHSTFSRAAAEVLTALTGSEYFPGGMSGFEIPADVFLQFERGPSEPMTLQWAKYYDAADQCALSRIWGGIHPPADDIPGRHLGREVGKDAFVQAMRYINGIDDSEE